MSWVRAGIFLREAARERARLRSVAETLGLPVFGSDVLRTLRALKPDATTAFILGTGASAADLSDQKLEYIHSQFSIGVNQWILHPLIPDVYAYEVDPDARLLQALDRPEVRDNVPHLLFLKPSRHEDYSNVSYIPDFMRENSFLYSRVNIWTRKDSNIGPDFRALTRLIPLLSDPAILLDNGASVARMVGLVSLMGFERVVLVGVDLNSVAYFWHRAPALVHDASLRDFGTAQTGSSHETLTNASRPFSIDTFLASVGAVVPLDVESPQSLLAGLLPVWDFKAVATQ